MKHLFIGLVRAYQFFISPFFPTSCRYYPTCSQYAIDAFQTQPVIKAFGLTVWRILRCNPFSSGGADPVPGTATAPDYERDCSCKTNHVENHKKESYT